MKRLLTGLLALCMIAALAACDRSSVLPMIEAPENASPDAVQTEDSVAEYEIPKVESPVAGKIVALIPGAAEGSGRESAYENAQKYASLWDMEVCCPDGGQLEAVQKAIDQGVDGICIAADADEALEAKLKEARAAGIFICTWDADVSPDARSLAVTPGSASALGIMLVEMGVTSLAERGVDPDGEVLYLWSCSGEDGAENDLCSAGRSYIHERYPEWIELDVPYGSARLEEALDDYPNADLILCAESDVLIGQCRAAQSRGLTAGEITITGFAPLNDMKDYLDSGICTRWGSWDCGIEAAMGCYLAAWLSTGNVVHVGDVVSIPQIGCVQVQENSVLSPEQETGAVNNGVVQLPERVVFTAENAAGGRQ